MILVVAVSVLALLCPFVLPDEQGDALYALKKSLGASGQQLKDWTNYHTQNPCSWSQVICNDDNNVMSVSLSSMGFKGTLSPSLEVLKALVTLNLKRNNIRGGIPEEFGNMFSLTDLDLKNNRLTGSIPASLGNLKKLQFLILSGNNLSGTIPESLARLQFLNILHLNSNNLTGQIPEPLFYIPNYNYTGNNLNCGEGYTHPCEKKGSTSDPKVNPIDSILILTVGGIIIGISGFISVLVWKFSRKIQRPDIFVDVEGEVDRRVAYGNLKRFSWRELQLATGNFSESNIIGQGGFGKVYRGLLPDNTKIAVKRLTDYDNPRGDESFQREVEMISVATHRNLLPIIGFCTLPKERVLVYPFMPNLCLAHRLREIKPGEPVLDWSKRNRIALGAARGLEYLHEHCNPKIIHRDVKAANVMIDEEFEAVVGDFGLAKLVDVRRTEVTTQVRGTMGHIAPEYLSTGKSSERTDVFGYGIMLLELVTGQRTVDFSRLVDKDEEVLLLDCVKKMEDEKRLGDMVDKNLGDNYNMEEVEAMIQVALLCTQTSPEDRPKMSEVVRMLEGEGLAERWQEWLHMEVTRRQDETRLQVFDWEDEGSLHELLPIELSGGR